MKNPVRKHLHKFNKPKQHINKKKQASKKPCKFDYEDVSKDTGEE